MTETTVLPMFPLGTVLVPGMVLPLQVFEPRYQRLVADVTADGAAGEFGVVLIERGQEVGGGDTRTGVGTVARIVQREDVGGGRTLLATVGVRRIRIERWLDDDPYPRAEVVDWPDEPPPDAGADTDLARRRAIEAQVRRVAALRTELAEPAPPVDIRLVDDPVLAIYEALLVAVPGMADRQDLLAAPTVTERAERLAAVLADETAVLEARLGGR